MKTLRDTGLKAAQLKMARDASMPVALAAKPFIFGSLLNNSVKTKQMLGFD